jgi:nitric oxide reductase NorD protein
VPSSDDVRLSGEQLGEQLDSIFSFDVSSGRSYEELTAAIAPLPRGEQDFALHWATVAARTHLEIGYLVVLLAPQALRRLSVRQAEAWVVAALEGFDRTGLRTAVVRLRDIEGFARAALGHSVTLESIDARLARFLQGLSGRSLHVAAAATAWTDTGTIFLPAAIDVGGHAAGAERYKAMAALLWAQARYGSFNVDLDAALAACPDPAIALAWLTRLEAIRLTARLGRDFPGLRAELAELLQGLPQELDSARAVLAVPQATVSDSLSWLQARTELLGRAPPADPWLGELRPQEARRMRGARIVQQAEVLRLSVAELLSALQEEREARDVELDVDAERLGVRITVDGQELALPPEGFAAAQSLIQDLGEIPPELLVPAGPADGAPTDKPGSGAMKNAGTMETRADLLLDEWDYRRHAYRRGWCHVYLQMVGGEDTGYVPEVRARHAPLVRQLRRRFEAMRGEDRTLRRQADGPEVDIDALVEAIADRRGGAEPGTRLFCRRQRDERSLAAAFLVDMSGSTEGWINDAEREALVMLCEALEMLDDRYAIWGFSGWTRTRCDIYRIKEFDEPYDAKVQARIAAIKPRDYTRMGPPIRYLTRQLLSEPARHRLLVSLSDGRPDDFGDDYRSQYGIEDTRQALLEARQAGIRSFCVTLDKGGADYLKYMYGPAAFAVLDDVRKLPLKIAEIYRKLTF